MTDLVTDLRRLCGHDSRTIDDCLTCKAADEIEQLQRDRKTKFEGAVPGVVLQAGNDDEGHPRVIVYSTRAALAAAPNLIGARVRIVMEGSRHG